MDVSLVIVKADGSKREFPIKLPRVVIGRHNTCGLRIPLHSVSRKHCEILVAEDQIRIRDLGSSNGTLHNDKRITEAMLKAGDLIQLGPVVFTLIVNGKPDVVNSSMTLIAKAQKMESEKSKSGESDASADSDFDASGQDLELAAQDNPTAPLQSQVDGKKTSKTKPSALTNTASEVVVDAEETNGAMATLEVDLDLDDDDLPDLEGEMLDLAGDSDDDLFQLDDSSEK